MGMYSHTRNDGKRETMTDFPYRLKNQTRGYFNKETREEAMERAERFAEFIRGRRPKETEVTITDHPNKQSIYVIEVEAVPHRPVT